MQIRYYLAASAAALSLATVMAAPAYAQETTSAVRGSVTGDGAPLAGAQVRVIHTPSGTVSSSTTDAQGNFSANGLRVGGPFTVEVNADGYEQSSITDVFLQAGQPLRLPVALQSQAVIVVTASSVSNSLETSKGPITALGREEIDGVASVNRDIRDLARRDPFVTMDLTNSRTIEIAGNNGRLNRFSVDGVQFSDDFGLNNGGLPTNRGPVPFDAIEQFTVKVAPYDVSEGDFQGGSINVVIRSGANDFHGGAFFTYTDDSLTGSRTRDRTVDLKFDSKQYGGNISGPIIKDKLFFMFAYEKTEESTPINNGVGAGFGAQVPGITQAQIDRVTQIANSTYSYDPQGQLTSGIEEDEKFIAKLDWNIADGHRASATYIRNVGNRQFQQNTFLNAPAGLGLRSNGYELVEEINTGVFQLNSEWTSNLSTEFRASYRDYNRDQTPFGGREFGQFEVCLDEVSAGSAIACGGSRIFFGPDVSRQANDLNTENLSLDFTTRLNVGDHALKLMVGFTETSTFNLFLQRPLGDFYFDSIADFQNQQASRLRYQNAVPSLDPNDAAASFDTQNWTFGFQDDWQVSDTLQITYGARYDLFNNPTRPPLNSNFLARTGFSNIETFNGRGVFQPRFGFTWQPMDRLSVSGGAGIFAGGTPDVFLSNSFSNTGQLTNGTDIARNPTAAGGCTATGLSAALAATLCPAALNNVTGSSINPLVGNFISTNTASLAAATVNALDPNLKIARNMRVTLSASYEADLGPLGDGWLFGLTGIYGEQIYGYTWTDLRSTPIGTLPDGRLRYGPVGPATTNQDLLMTNSTQGRSWIGAARIEKSWDFGLNISGSYTRSDVKDVNALTSATAGSLYGNNAMFNPNGAAYGTSIYEIRDQWKFGIDFNRALFDSEHKTRISLFGEYRSGRPYSLTALDNSGGRTAVYGTVGTGGLPLLYVPTAGGDPRVVFDTPASEAAFNSAVSQLGIEKFRGSVISKNTQRAPDFFKVDLHIEQELPLLFGSKLSVFADVENLLNMIDRDWGSLRQVGFPQTAPLVRVACAATSGNNCTQYRYSNVLLPNEALITIPSLYQIRVGARIKF